MTHLLKVAAPGHYRRGEAIGVIGDYPGSSADHVHFAIHQGKSSEAGLPSMWVKPGDLLAKPGPSGALPPPSGDTGAGTGKSTNPVPAALRLALSRADAAAAAAALTSGKADDRAAIAEQKRSLEDIISFLRAKLRTNVGTEQQITLEDLLKGDLESLASLRGAKTVKKGGAGIGTIEGLRNTIDKELRGLPADLTPAAQAAVAKLEQIRKKLVPGLDPKTLADDRAAISRWGDALKTAISDQADKQRQAAQAAADAAQAAWDRSWQNAASRVLRDFSEQVVAPQLDAFDRATSAGLKRIQDEWQRQLDTFDRETQAGLARIAARYAALTPAEQALQAFEGQRSADQAAKRKTDLQQQIRDTEAQLASLSSGGTLIDVATGRRSVLSSTDAAAKAKDLQKQLLDLQDQFHQLELDDQQQALQTAADQSRKAADEQARQAEDAYQAQRDLQRSALADREQAALDSYQRMRDGQRQGLQDMLDDQAAMLTQDLDDWNTWLEKKAKSWQDFLAWLGAHGVADAGLPVPAFKTGASTGVGGGAVNFSGARPPISRTGPLVPFAHGGKIPGVYVGRDSVPILASPGETIIDRDLTAALERLAAQGGLAGGPTVILDRPRFLGATETQVKRALADAVEPYLGQRPQITVQR